MDIVVGMKPISLFLLVGLLPLALTESRNALGQTDPASAPGVSAAGATPDRDAEIRELRIELRTIAARLDSLEAEGKAAGASAPTPPAPTPSAPAIAAAVQPVPPAARTASTPAAPAPAPAVDQTLSETDRTTLGFFRGTTLNFNFDGYYSYNTNEPIGQVNQLRAYTISSNSFSINQADVIVEHLPTPESRFGGRIDLQFGQATETLQGSSASEQRPQVWRNLYQAYGSYLAPIGTGLHVDFGKWGSALGAEGNYTKDQINYSRSLLFNFLPFYHMGFRTDYDLTPKVNVAYWLVNGAQQTEDFNGFKSQNFELNLKPAKSLSWTTNYYFGQEQRGFTTTLNPGLPTGPVQPGLPTTNITPTPNGREHIFDTYATWIATPKLTLAGEADLVIDRVYSESPEQHAAGSAFYARYALSNSNALAGRVEYLDDRSGLFSDLSQALKEFTFTYEHSFAPGFLARAEFRRDFTNVPYFLTEGPGLLSHEQPTVTLGLVYWWGMKQGSW